MIKVGVFLGSSAASGGMFQYSESILDSLALLVDQKKINVTVAYVDEVWSKSSYHPLFKVVKLKNGVLGRRFALLSMATLLSGSFIRRFLSRFNPLVAELQNFNCDLWIFPSQDPIAFQVPFKSIVSIHDLMHRYEPSFPEASGGIRYLVRESRFRNLSRYCTGIIVDSSLGKNQLVESYNVDEKKIYSLPYIPKKIINVTEEEGIAFKQCYNLPDRFLFYPAQFWLHKNHAVLLDALYLIKVKGIECNICFTGGKHHEYQNLVHHVERLNLKSNVKFLGFRDDKELAFLYSKARAMVMPTYFGPTNIPPLEANQYGCPVAVSKIYAMPEQLGKGAIYFDQTDKFSVAAAIEKLWTDDDLCRTLVGEGYKNSSKWGLEALSKSLLEVLREVKGI